MKRIDQAMPRVHVGRLPEPFLPQDNVLGVSDSFVFDSLLLS